MKRIFITLFITLGFFISNAQEYQEIVKIGDPLIIAEKENGNYLYIDIPRKNFIIKRGGIADMKSIYNKRVLVKSICERNGRYKVTLKPLRGKFFMAYSVLKADLNKAIEHGELIIPSKNKKDSLAR